MERITQKDLEYLVKRINEVTDSPAKSGAVINGNYSVNIGNYHLDYANGGVSLVRMVSAGGGVTTISRSYHGTKRELYYWMNAFLTGLSTAKKCPDSCCYGTSRENCTLGKETASECNSPS